MLKNLADELALEAVGMWDGEDVITFKKKSKNACRGKKCLKPAISFLIKFGTHFFHPFLHMFLNMFYTFFYHFFEKG